MSGTAVVVIILALDAIALVVVLAWIRRAQKDDDQ